MLTQFCNITEMTKEEAQSMVDECYTILHDKLGYNVTKPAIIYNMTVGAYNKRKIIKWMINDPRYIGKLRLSTNIYVERSVSEQKDYIRKTIASMSSSLNAKRKMGSKVDEKGRTSKEIYMDNIKDMPLVLTNKNFESFKPVRYENNNFDSEGYYVPSLTKYNEFNYVTNRMLAIDTEVINDYTADIINDAISLKKPVVAGMKSGRAVVRILNHYGFTDKDKEYQKLIPILTDALSGKPLKMRYILSVNFIDYLLGSEGNTWKSCHTIDPNNTLRITKKKGNKIEDYRGMCKSGNLSYATDGTDIITFGVPMKTNNEDITMTGKIYRCHMTYDDKALLQGRVYPQTNDYLGGNLRKAMRFKMQNIISDWEGIPYIADGNGSDTWIRKGNASSYTNFILSSGNHYRDYHNESCQTNITYIRGTELRDRHIHIGREEICLKCGMRAITSGYNITCNRYDCVPMTEEDCIIEINNVLGIEDEE